MNRSTTYLLSVALILSASAAFAKGSSHVSSDGAESGGVMSVKKYPRAMVWHELRNWQSTSGELLVCPEVVNTEVSYGSKDCYNPNTLKKGESKQKGWIPLSEYKIEGMELKAYEFRFIGSGGNKMLIAYYGPPENTGWTRPEEATLRINGPVQVQADRVIIRSKK